jgi:leader peptidase (prepilin peptidase)/N-methyltransferase
MRRLRKRRGVAIFHDNDASADAMERISPGAKQTVIARYFGIGAIALAVVSASALTGHGLSAISGAVLGLLMLAIAVVDARHFIIPNGLTLAAFLLGLVNGGLQDQSDQALTALLRAAVLAMSFLALRACYQYWRGREGIGLGDVKLAGVAGAWLGWAMLPVAVEIAALAALAFYSVRWFVGGGGVQRLTRVPFGLFFAPAIWLCWLWQARFPIA